jgi:hypothetical protein
MQMPRLGLFAFSVAFCLVIFYEDFSKFADPCRDPSLLTRLTSESGERHKLIFDRAARFLQ